MSAAFQAITVVGGVVPPSLLGRVQAGEVNDARSMAPASFHLAGTETVRDAASRTWMYLQGAWRAWRESDATKRPDGQGAGTGDARQKWLLVLLRELGYGQVPATPGGLTIGGEAYPISHRWESVPIHLLGPGVDLDKRTPKVEGAARRAPQAMVQEFLNREDTYLWAILSNGLRLRLLRDSTALAGSAYIEFDLETIFESDLYSEFQLFWQLCHQSRLDKRGGSESPPSDCWLELWRGESVEAGARALDKLGAGVEKALDFLGSGFLRHPDNRWLVDALHSGDLSHRDFHKALLRTAYRLLFIFVVEDRGALLDPAATTEARHRYETYFSTQRLRKMSRTRDGGPHPDLWRTQKLVLGALGGEGLGVVGLPALGGLFDPDPRAARLAGQPHGDLLLGAELANQDFLKAIRVLGWVAGKTGRLQPVDYRHLGAEELGSVYESLLELVPRVDTETRSFELAHLAGNERKTTGSYYTPPSLVSALLDTALDPLLDQAVNGAAGRDDAEARLLALTVCDPASGSGGFLVAAARRIARRLAEVRAGENEPTPGEVQSALHDVVERCIYGVDMNDLAAELAKVSLWLEAMQPGKPLGFLDARIKIGNSLLGTTPALLAGGVPDEAFGVLDGDDAKYSAEIKKRNRLENARSSPGSRFKHGGQDSFNFAPPVAGISALIGQRRELVKPVYSAAEARDRAAAYAAFDHSRDMEQRRLHADAWCAAFVWPLITEEAEPPTSALVRQLGEADELTGHSETVAMVRHLSEEYRFFHWHLEFPEVFGDPQSADASVERWPKGFSCMLGNPPWEKIKLQEKEFFGARDARVANAKTASERRSLIRDLAKTDVGTSLLSEYNRSRRQSEAFSFFVRKSGRFPLGGRGDVNTYTVFTELFSQIVSPSGRAGVIVKTGIATDDTTKELFQALSDEARVLSLFDFENTQSGGGRYFVGAHASERFSLLTILGQQSRAGKMRIGFMISHPDKIALESYFLLPSDIKLMNPISGTLPVFKAQRDVDITREIYGRVPIFKSGAWGEIAYDRMFDVTNDSGHFRSAASLETGDFTMRSDGNLVSDGKMVVRVYEGKMVSHWDHRNADVVWSQAAVHRQRQPKYISEYEKSNPERLAVPGYWVDHPLVPAAARSWQIGFASVTAPKNQRTFSVAPVPPAAATNSLPLIRIDQPTGMRLCLLANLSSFVFDYVARQKVGGVNMNFFIVDQLPVLSPQEYSRPVAWDTSVSYERWISDRAYELVFTANDMQSVGHELGDQRGPFSWIPARRRIISAELDAAYFHLYGLDRDTVGYVMDTFNVTRRVDAASFGDYRTKMQILEVFEAMQDAIKTGVPYESALTPPPGQGPRHPAKEISA